MSPALQHALANVDRHAPSVGAIDDAIRDISFTRTILAAREEQADKELTPEALLLDAAFDLADGAAMTPQALRRIAALALLAATDQEAQQ